MHRFLAPTRGTIVKSQIQGRTHILIPSRYSATIQVTLVFFSRRQRTQTFIKICTFFPPPSVYSFAAAAEPNLFGVRGHPLAPAAAEASAMNDAICAVFQHVCLFFLSFFFLLPGLNKTAVKAGQRELR